MLGKYRIFEELGRGGFAAVYRALNPTLRREVALKVLHPQLTSDPQFVQRFDREATAAANLEHPHIVPIYDKGEVDGRFYIEMRLVRGGSLARRLAERGRLPWDEASRIMIEVGGALGYAHDQGVLHRDLKPANILLDERSGALLSDFGLVRILDDPTRYTSSNPLTMSTGEFVGTPAYIAPELYEGATATAATDIYALGCVLYEILTGEALFKGATPMVLMRAHDIGAQFPTVWPLDIPPDVVPVLQRAVARKPGERYQGTSEFLDALRAVETAVVEQRISAEVARLTTEATKACGDGRFEVASELAEQALKLRAEDAAATEVRNTARAALARKQQLAPVVASYLKETREAEEQLSTKREQLTAERHARSEALQALANEKAQVETRLAEIVAGQATSTQALALLDRHEAELDQCAKRTTERVAQASQLEALWAGGKLVEVEAWLGERRAPGSLPREAPASVAPSEPLDRTVSPTPQDDGKAMVCVPAGVFLYLYSKEKRSLPEYWVDKTPVTNAEYARFVTAVGCEPPKHWRGTSPPENIADHPVVNVSWDDAAAYCQWAGKRLPTGEEWEKAARGTDGRAYAWGDVFDTGKCNTAGGNVEGTTPVGRYSPRGDSPYGCVDMTGNVWEWTTESFSESEKTVRGGSWLHRDGLAGVVCRLGARPTAGDLTLGFRCVRSKDQ